MEVRLEGGSYARLPQDAAAIKRDKARRSEPDANSATDTVQSLIARFAEMGETRSEAVGRASEKVTSGELYDTEVLEAAAERLLSEGI